MAFRDPSYGNNIKCVDRVVIGHRDTNLTSDINIIGANNRTVKINGIVPSGGGGGGVPDPLNIGTIVVATSLVSNGITDINGQLQANLGIDVSAGNISMSGTGQNISTGATGTVSTFGVNVSGNATMQTINCTNGAEANRIIYCPRFSTRFLTGGFLLRQPEAVDANGDTLFIEMPGTGAKLDILKAGGTQGTLTDTVCRFDNDGHLRVTNGVCAPLINTRQDSSGGWEMSQLEAGVANEHGLAFESPDVAGSFGIFDETGSQMMIQSKTGRRVYTPMNVNGNFHFGDYNFTPVCYERNITNFEFLTSGFGVGSKIFTWGRPPPVSGGNADWTNINTGATNQSLSDSQAGFYKLTITQTTNTPNKSFMIFSADVCFSLANDSIPKMRPALSYSYSAYNATVDYVPPILSLVPALYQWTAYLEFPNIPVVAPVEICNMTIRLIKMPY